jgi:hypothetical protein
MKLQRRQTRGPKRTGYSALLHLFFLGALPLALYVLIRLDFTWIAVLVILLSKWRIFAVKARHWPANIRANAVDIFVGLSAVAFIDISSTQLLQLLWVGMYILWLVFVKPRSKPLWIGIQAIIAQTVSLVAVFQIWSEASITTLVFVCWGIAYLCSRHFLAAFDEAMARGTAYAWAFFVASIVWLSGHWLIYYGPIAQPALLISALGYGLASIYYLEHTDRLTSNVRRQFIAVMGVIVLFVIVFSDWTDKTI